MMMAMLVSVASLAPVSSQIFSPALPSIQAGFAVSVGMAQLTLSLPLVTMALTTLSYGPLSDRYGRRPVLLAGIAMFIVGTLMCWVAWDIATLVLGRVVQAGGSAAGMVLARSIVRDFYGRERSANMLGYLTTVMVVAPMLAPVLGGILTDSLGWRANFAVLTAAGVFAIALIAWRLPETNPHLGQITSIGEILGGMGDLIRSRLFLGYALQTSFSMAAFFAFTAAAPYLMINVLQRPATEYGIYFLFVSAAFALGGFATGRFAQRIGSERMANAGAVTSLVLAIGGLLWVALWGLTPMALFLPPILISVCQGLTIPNGQAMAIGVAPKLVGAASGLIGFLQMALSAIATQLVGMLEDGTPYPMLICLLVCTICSLASIWLVRTARRIAV
ncbi:MAG: multidrug effflux MFS transporter [Alphaproteobacteria bacterium]